jgi:hypothetical protein
MRRELFESSLSAAILAVMSDRSVGQFEKDMSGIRLQPGHRYHRLEFTALLPTAPRASASGTESIEGILSDAGEGQFRDVIQTQNILDVEIHHTHLVVHFCATRKGKLAVNSQC